MSLTVTCRALSPFAWWVESRICILDIDHPPPELTAFQKQARGSHVSRRKNTGLPCSISMLLIVTQIKKSTDSELLAKPGVIKARSHSEWPTRTLSRETPDLNRLACSGIRKTVGAQHAMEHTKPHPEEPIMTRYCVALAWPAPRRSLRDVLLEGTADDIQVEAAQRH